MKAKIIFLLFGMIFGILSACAQLSISDSLAVLLKPGNELEVYKDFLTDGESDSLSALRLHIQNYVMLAYQSKEENIKLEADYIRFRLYREEDNLDEALALADSMLKRLNLLSPPNIDIEIGLELGRSIIYDARGNSEEAVKINYGLIEKITNESLVDDAFNDDKFHYQNYMILANNYLFDNDSLSYDYSQKALKHARVLNKAIYILRSINHGYYSNYFSDNGPLLNTIADSCIRYAAMVKDIKSQGEAFMHKCNALVVLDQPDEAEVYCDKAIQTFSRISDATYISSVYNNIANVFEKTDDPSRSLPYYKESFEYAKIVQNGSGYLTPLNNLSRKYLSLGEYKASAEHFQLYADSVESHFETQLASQFSEAEAKYQNGQKEIEIAEQKLELANQKAIRNRVILGGSLLFLIGLALFQWYRNRHRRLGREAEFEMEQQRREATQLRDLDRMKTQFFTNVSHELRTPLTLITGPLESVLEKNRNIRLEKDLSLAYSNSKKLNGLVNEILDLAKIESGKMKIKPIAVHLHSLIRRLFFAFESYAETKGVKLELKNRVSESLNVKMDVDKFETIINNLLTNAIKFTGSGKEVLLDAAVSNGELLMYVKDEGIGIPAGDESRIFERFYQAEQGRASLSGGTGVGLALSKEIVELMGGEISANNNAKEGATFAMTIPVEITQDKPIPSLSDYEGSSESQYTPILLSGERPRVLIVEDNKDMAEYIASILDDYYECTFAKDGYDCLQKIQREHFDIISSDVMMPRMDGFTLKKRINELERFKSIPFIFLTARILEADKIEGLNLGVDDYITKPFNKREYLTRIHNLLKNKQERDEIPENEIDDSVDRKFIKKAERWVLDRLSDGDVKITALANELNYSQRQLGRIIKKLTGLTPVGFVLEVRLQKAYHMILEKKFETLSEVRFEVGIESASYFTTKFKERFGVLPSELMDS